jgi:nitrate/TMAO reductase-like tetraheme cytochrome c subunit
MRTVFDWFRRRPLRLLGGFIVFISTGLLSFLVLLDMLAGLNNPYLGILAYMIMPGVLGFGLLLVPLDAWVQRRRIARGQPVYPAIDLSNPVQRRIASFFMVTSVVILIVLTVITYRSVEFMDTRTFCGLVCHRVMIPEYTAYVRSPHAGVQCVACHIGPGAPWFVRSKLSGIPQVYHYILGDYERPLPTPVKALRPSRDTCENCHWPEQFYGSTLYTNINYKQDRNNTRDVKSMIMYIGSGGVPGSGIHSHMVSKIHYLPAVEDRSVIAWVRVERPDGSVQEFTNPSYQGMLDKVRSENQVRFMDCIDCHNRPAHDFNSFEDLLNNALTRLDVDPSLPYIKRYAMEAVRPTNNVPTRQQQAATVRRIEEIAARYQREMPDLYRQRRTDIDRSVEAIKKVYLGTYFPHMEVGPATYPNWRTHNGCFRCHGLLVPTKGTGWSGVLPANCDLCHSEQRPGGVGRPSPSLSPRERVAQR